MLSVVMLSVMAPKYFGLKANENLVIVLFMLTSQSSASSTSLIGFISKI
jgi:hypothetical protein